MSVLNVTHLTKIFTSGWWSKKDHTVVNGISFELHKGEVLGFLGPNGAGKTTTIQMLLGTLKPSSGSIVYFGENFSSNPISALKKIGYASGYDRLPNRLTVAENLDIIGRIYGREKRTEQLEKLLTTFRLWDLRDHPTGTLSAGQATRVMLAKAFLSQPEVVLLDEPTASLDPDVADEVRQFILSQVKERDTSILITSHNMDEVTQLCDRVLVLKNGSIIADKTPEALAQSVSKVRVNLLLSSDLDQAKRFLTSTDISSSIEGNQVTVTLEENNIASFLSSLGNHGIHYTYISIDKPTLEDYFISIARAT